MPVEIDEMTVDVDEPRPERPTAASTPPAAVDVPLRQIVAAIAEEAARRQRLVAD